MSAIQAIDRQSITKICSGQVVVDLATAVKEMVENSLDSGATSVEIKLKEMGSDSIEITDNGSGIDPANYANIALKHHTSKLCEFSDLNNVSSFGFRGEALNALCELSEAFTVTTKIEAEGIGSRLSFGKDGHLLSTVATARTTGTTVVVTKLFASLPVRRGEFIRTIKKQYQKMIKGLQSYAIIAVGVRMVVTNTGKGSNQIIMGTQLGNRMCDNISSIFGSKFLSSLIPISVTIEVTADRKGHMGKENEGSSSQDTNDVAIGYISNSQTEFGDVENNENDAAENKEEDFDIMNSNKNDSKCAEDRKYCTITGYVSKVGSGVGRSDNDRQFLYCNGRPVDIPKFSKALNEVWRRYEMKHKPACILDIRVPNGSFDVNLTPDKREIVLTHEAVLLEKFRENLEKLYVPSRQTFQLSQGLGGGTQQGLFDSAVFTSNSQSSSQSSDSTPVVTEENEAIKRNEKNETNADEDDEPVLLMIDNDDEENREEEYNSNSNYQSNNNDKNYEHLENRNVSNTTPPRKIVWLTENESAKSVQVLQQSSENKIKRKQESVMDTDIKDLCLFPNMPGKIPTPLKRQKLGKKIWVEQKSIIERVDMKDGGDDENKSGGSQLSRKTVFSENSEKSGVMEDRIDDFLEGEGRGEGYEDGDGEGEGDDVGSIKSFSSSSVTTTGLSSSSSSSSSPLAASRNTYSSSLSSSASSSTDLSKQNSTMKSQPQQRKDAKLSTVEIEEQQQQSAPIEAQVVWNFDPSKVIQQYMNNKNNFEVDKNNNDDNKSNTESRDMTLTKTNEDVNMNVNDNINVSTDEAERTLSRVLKKQDFSSMRIAGQFNLGFIIAELRGDLYILDQHACDEKYRFETLQHTTVIHQQPLIVPQYIEASASEELIIIENISTFQANGFNIKIFPDACPGKKVQLLAVPFSKHIQFGQDDVHELASLLSESQYGDGASYVSKLVLKNDNVVKTNKFNTENKFDDKDGVEISKPVNIRIPKLVSLFASRACRSAIMIGTAMQKNEMKAVVNKLEHIDQPWNCPHGRPTMRHLIDLHKIHKKRKSDCLYNNFKFDSYETVM